jgi:hypothetical protein
MHVCVRREEDIGYGFEEAVFSYMYFGEAILGKKKKLERMDGNGGVLFLRMAWQSCYFLIGLFLIMIIILILILS